MKHLFLLLLGLVSASLLAAGDVPYLSGRVTDQAEILSAEARTRLAATLKAHEEATSNQIAVLTVSSLEGDSVEEFANRVFHEWKLGQKGKDNGVLLLIAPQDRRLRIEVGYGLEGTLTDVAASRIIRGVITPRFKNNDFDGGVEEGIKAIIAALQGTPPQEPAAANGGNAKAENSFFEVPDMPITERILIGAFIFGMLGLFTAVGVFMPGMGWFLYFFLIPFWAMFPLVVVGGRIGVGLLGTYIVAFPIAKLILRRQPWYIKAAQDLKRSGHASVGGFSISSSSGGSDGGGGGFSGGGGDSGGGGASGSW